MQNYLMFSIKEQRFASSGSEFLQCSKLIYVVQEKQDCILILMMDK